MQHIKIKFSTNQNHLKQIFWIITFLAFAACSSPYNAPNKPLGAPQMQNAASVNTNGQQRMVTGAAKRNITPPTGIPPTSLV